jgi:hypothetical protein
MRKLLALPSLAALALVVVTIAGAQTGGTEAYVSNGSPTAPFSQNKQNEPALAVDAAHPNILAAGANDNIDMEACNAGARPASGSERKSARCGAFAKPSDGLEPSTPSLPWRCSTN